MQAGGAGAVSESFLKGKVTLHCGDCLEVLPTLAENSVDACVCDPPYHLTSIIKRFANANVERENYAVTSHSGYMSRGFMGKQWDGGDIAFRPEVWREVYRVLKPGAHLLAFGGTRTYHRMACAIEDAGFEIRDTIMWVYGSGFPKSHDVSKGIDRAAGAEREVIASGASVKRMIPGADQNKQGWEKTNGRIYVPGERPPITAAARQWEGWGTALKPAVEPIILARKPLSEGTVAANVLRWGTGAINVDECRVVADDQDKLAVNWDRMQSTKQSTIATALSPKKQIHLAEYKKEGRWPANLIHDGSEEVLAGFPESKSSGGCGDASKKTALAGHIYGEYSGETLGQNAGGLGDSGSAARFFYTAKADTDDRLGSKHPTVKPLDLIQYLVRLVTPLQGMVLDCFAGTGTMGEAAFREGFRAILIEREAEYQADIRRRMALCLSGPDERAREAVKARMKDKPIDAGPLFGGSV